ncbi:MAG: hypothetical protein ACJ73S_26390 [Mycobacteriales bacterium]
MTSPAPGPGPAEEPAAPDSGPAPERGAGPARRLAEDEDRPVSQQDALRGVEQDDDVVQAEATRVAAIAARSVEWLRTGATGPVIGALNLFQGPVTFGGDMNVAGAGGGRRATRGPERLTAAALSAHTTGYLPPPRYERARTLLRDGRVLVLAEGSGREAAGVNLLTEVLDAGERAVYRMDRATAGALFDGGAGWKPPHQHCGYLVTAHDGYAGETGPVPDRLDGAWLERLVRAVTEARCYLVLVVDAVPAGLRAAGNAENLARHVVDDLGGPDLTGIVELRVLGADPDPAEAARLRARLTDTGALEALREQPWPRTAARLAAVLRDGGDLAAEVRALRDPTDQVLAWFATHGEPESVCFALAAATLAGTSYLTVADAAVALHRVLWPPARDEELPPLRFRRRMAVEQPWLEVDTTGGSGVPVVRFRNPLLQQAVLEYAWTDLDGQRDGLLAWLGRLATHPDLEVRARAAVAAGVIAGTDLNHAVHRLLRPWAEGTSAALRQAAALALGVVGSRAGYASAVWELLEGWAAGSPQARNRRLPTAAALAAGGLLGTSDPERALAVLRTVLYHGLDRDDWGPFQPVSLALSQLAEADHVAPVLAALLEWSAARDGSPEVAKALAAFVTVARQVPANSPLPPLLAAAPDHHDALVELWARALARQPVQPVALAALREWLDTHAATDRAARRAVFDLVAGIARVSGRNRERLEWYLRLWADDPNEPSAMSRRALGVLERPANPAPNEVVVT